MTHGLSQCSSCAFQVLELVGTTTLEDSLQCANQHGLVCMTGMVGNQWALDNFSPMGSIPTTVCLTTYAGELVVTVLCMADSIHGHLFVPFHKLCILKYGLCYLTEI